MAMISMSAFSDEDSFIRNVYMSGELKNETAVRTQDGLFIGAVNERDNEVMKFENSARAFINGDIGEESTFHAELRFVVDSSQVDGEDGESYKFHESYTQRDFFRELYVDTEAAGWSMRLGKQQVVWGTADGIKLLDIINPTDYAEMAQNTMDESRIPVWMINAERDLENGANIQFVISQPRENVFPGMDRNISTEVRQNVPITGGAFAGMDITNNNTDPIQRGHQEGHPFILLGVDSITGKENGFINIVPDLGSISTGFFGQFQAGLAPNPLTVSQFAGMTNAQLAAQVWPGTATMITDAIAGGFDGAQILGAFVSNYDTNLSNATSAADWGVVQDSAFEYMGNAAFGTFATFVDAKSQYVYDMPDDWEVDIAMRYKDTLDNGLNYSVNYSYNYDKNPIVNISWRNDAGTALSQQIAAGTNIITLWDGATQAGVAYGGEAPTLRFEHTVERAHNLGAAFDYGLDTKALGPIVLRGEFLYQKDVYSPVVDLAAMSIGDLPGALQMIEGDRFKYVLGVDVTALTNMMVSFQFIQDMNLDYIDGTSTAGTITGSRYTADFATMHMSNNFNKAEENKEFYSLFLSKPFGAEQQHRWNNIYMFEENGGNWNRFDVEYSFDDRLIGMFEYNAYWGDDNTQFGQLDNSSNVQVGIKYLFDDY